MKMNPERLRWTFALALLLAGPCAWAERSQSRQPLRPIAFDVRATTGRTAIVKTVHNRFRMGGLERPKVTVFENEEIRVQLEHPVAGRKVYVTYTAESGLGAQDLFRIFHGVGAGHMGRASSVNVLIDDAVGKRLGHEFLNDLFSAVRVDTVEYAAESGSRVVNLGQSGTRPMSRKASDHTSEPLLWGGSSHPELLANLARALNIRGDRVDVDWKGPKLRVALPSDPKNRDVVLVQTKRVSDSERFHQDLVEMLRIAWEAKQRGAASITLVTPYLPYSRSDRMDAPGITIGAALLPQLMKGVGIDRVVFYSVHQAQEVGFFQAVGIEPVHASGEAILARRAASEFKAQHISPDKLVVVAPDGGAEKRARVFARSLAQELGVPELPMVTASKERTLNNISLRFNANVEGKVAIAIDDETLSGKTLNQLAQAARAQGAQTVYAAVSHLAGPAEHIDPKTVAKLFVLDTLPQDEVRLAKQPGIEVVSIADHLASIVRALHSNEPLDDHLFLEHP
jgi:ribose-phosphate pyrophosphokinase